MPASARWKTIWPAPGMKPSRGAMPTICWRRSASGSGAISADVAEFGGDIDRALAAIKARVLLMPGQTDRYFDVRDNEDEIGRLVNAKSAELHPIPSIHGHRAGNPVNNPVDRAFITAEISALLQS